MELWFTEYHTDNVKFSMRVNKHLAGVKSDFQKIDVFDTPENSGGSLCWTVI